MYFKMWDLQDNRVIVMRIMTVFWDFAPYNQGRNDEGSTAETD
jgi:hypothetical protein